MYYQPVRPGGVMNKFTYTSARENFAQVLDQAISGEAVEITWRGGDSAVVISKTSFESLRKAKLDAEFAELIGQFDQSNKALTDR
jgi:antitoxin Phd